MKCKFCNFIINLEDRKMPTATDDDREKCWIKKDGRNYNLEVEFDGGYGFTEIECINNCPLCGRKLKNESF